MTGGYRVSGAQDHDITVEESGQLGLAEGVEPPAAAGSRRRTPKPGLRHRRQTCKLVFRPVNVGNGHYLAAAEPVEEPGGGRQLTAQLQVGCPGD